MKETIAARLEYLSPEIGDGRVLLIMLPGAGMHAADFFTHDMVSPVQSQTCPIDIVALEFELGIYLEDKTMASVLHEHAILPALNQGYQRIWLLGISLGGMGALLYSSIYWRYVTGIFLLAPFIGTRGTVAALSNAGGFEFPLDRIGMTNTEQSILEWVAQHLKKKQGTNPQLYLGYGRQDRFCSGAKLLARYLPSGNICEQDGGHDWPTWKNLWYEFLSRSPFLQNGI
ncbi:hypothetical protein [Acidithiobacillus sp. AMEEHan]|uniref:hypothetical protein n=1 Tax=Acidithiobacillus sp. AMEEHan TaxID=2994951 RepID=UPI0027E440DB|nr:hypothetical protein [Acidithiobacillus sp. AMEEHan]